MTYEHELEINAFGGWLLEQGKISQADLSAWFARTESEKAGQAQPVSGEKHASFTEHNKQEFSELCQQYSQTLLDMEAAERARDVAWTNAEEASEHSEHECRRKQRTGEQLKAYALLFGFVLPAKMLAIPEYVDEENLPF